MSNREKASLNVTVPENLVKTTTTKAAPLCYPRAASTCLLLQPHLACQSICLGNLHPCPNRTPWPWGPQSPQQGQTKPGRTETAANPITALPELCLPCPAQLTASEHNAQPWTAVPPAAFHSSAPTLPWTGLD